MLPTLPGDPPGHPDTALIQENEETLLFPQMFHNAQSLWDSQLLPTQGALGAPRFAISGLPVLGSRDRLPWDKNSASLGSASGRRQLDLEAVCAQLDRTVNLGWGSSQACGLTGLSTLKLGSHRQRSQSWTSPSARVWSGAVDLGHSVGWDMTGQGGMEWD